MSHSGEQRLEHLYLQLLEYKKDAADSIAAHIEKSQKLWLDRGELMLASYQKRYCP